MLSLREASAGCRVRLYLSSPWFQCQSLYYSRAYCSDDCQTYDVSSPSISSPSSTRSSPNIACAYGDEVPPLVPSALGSALKSYMAFNRYNVSSSSTSSTSRSFTDDEEDHFGSGSSDHDVSDGIYDGNSKSVTIPSGLSYTRRPSGTNNSSTVPHPHRRISSDSFAPVQNIPRSVPIYSHSQVDDDDYFDVGSLPEDAVDVDDSDLLSDQDWYRLKSKYQTTKTSKRSRNRGSLPACFSLLQTTSKDIRSSPVMSSSSGNTIASPPTPKARFGNILSQAQYSPTVHSTPRGRRRDPVTSRGARRTVDPSASGSRSGTRPMAIEESSRLAEHSSYSRTDLKGSTEKLVDWSHRGRATLRRNSSPLPKMLIDTEDPALVLGGAVKNRPEDSGSQFRVRTRGRARVEDLGRDSYSTDAPGFGYGRSGLLDRERCTGAQSMRFLPC